MAKSARKAAPKKRDAVTAKGTVKAKPRATAETYKRSDIARELGVTTTQVRRLQLNGELVGKKDRHGTFWFSAADVQRIREKRAKQPGARVAEGPQAAKAFSMFTEGKALHDVVVALEIAPGVAAKLHAQWSESNKSGWHIPERIVLMLRERGLESPLKVVELIDQKNARVRSLKLELERLQARLNGSSASPGQSPSAASLTSPPSR